MRRQITKYRILQSCKNNRKKLKRKLYLLTIGLVIILSTILEVILSSNPPSARLEKKKEKKNFQDE